MSAIEIQITSTDYQRPNFCWFEVYGSVTDWGATDADWVANAEWSDIAFATRVIHAQLTAGTTYYHKVRAVYDNGTTQTALGALITTVAPNDAIPGAVVYKGTWNASTNTPTIPAAASGNNGWYYRVAVAGSTSEGGITDWKVGDWIISDGTAWQKVDNTDQVTSVAGRQGAVVLAAADISDASANGRSLITAANYAAMKVLLAIAAGDVSGLGSLATASSITASLISDASANGRSLIQAASYAAMKVLLAISAADISGLAASATTDTTNAANISSGKIPKDRLPARASWTPADTSGGGLAFTGVYGFWVDHGDHAVVTGLCAWPANSDTNFAKVSLPVRAYNGGQGYIPGAFISSYSALKYLQANANNFEFALYSDGPAQITNAQMSGESIGFSFIVWY